MERYGAYKDSGVEWIGEIPEHWARVRVGSEFYMKGRIGWQGLKAEEFIDEGPYLVTGTDFANGRVNWETCYHISQDRFDEAPEIHVKNGDLLITKDGTIGKLALIVDAPESVSLNSHLLLMRPLDNEISNRFLFWVLSSGEFSHYTEISQSGTIMASLSQDKISRFMYGCPDLREQEAIADYLDARTAEVDALVADCEREVGLLREYRKAVISEAVTKGLNPDAPMKDSGVEWIGEIPEGWACSSLSRVIKFIQTGPFGSQLHAEDYSGDGEVCVVNPANIIAGKIDVSTCNRISKEVAKTLSQHMMHEGSIVFGRRGEMGRCALVEVDGLFCGTGSIQMELQDVADPSFAVYYLQCDFVKSYLELKSVGTTLQNLNTSIIASTPFVIAPLQDQRAIVDYLEVKTTEIDSLIEAKQEMADKLREYRKSLISEAVTGKFKVPGVDK